MGGRSYDRGRGSRPPLHGRAAAELELQVTADYAAGSVRDLALGAALMMSGAARPEPGAVCATSPPIAAAVELASVLLVELGDRRADVGRGA